MCFLWRCPKELYSATEGHPSIDLFLRRIHTVYSINIQANIAPLYRSVIPK